MSKPKLVDHALVDRILVNAIVVEGLAETVGDVMPLIQAAKCHPSTVARVSEIRAQLIRWLDGA